MKVSKFLDKIRYFGKKSCKDSIEKWNKKTSSSFRELSSPIQNLFCIVMTPMKKMEPRPIL
jgi:hypothetical protein